MLTIEVACQQPTPGELSFAFRHNGRLLSLESLLGEVPLGSATALAGYRRDITGFRKEWRRLYGRRVETWESELQPQLAHMCFQVMAGGRRVQVVLAVCVTGATTLNALIRSHYAGRLQATFDRLAETPLPDEPVVDSSTAMASIELQQLARVRWLFHCLAAGLRSGDPHMFGYFNCQSEVSMSPMPEAIAEGVIAPCYVPPQKNGWSRHLDGLRIALAWEMVNEEGYSFNEAYFIAGQEVDGAAIPTAEEPYPLV